MNTIILIIHVISSLLVLGFAVFTLVEVFRLQSLHRRIDRMTQRMRPLIIGRGSKKHIVDVLVLDGFPREEADELYDRLSEQLLPKKEKAEEE